MHPSSRQFIALFISGWLWFSAAPVQAEPLDVPNADFGKDTARWEMTGSPAEKIKLDWDGSMGHAAPGSARIVSEDEQGQFTLGKFNAQQLSLNQPANELHLSVWVRMEDDLEVWLEAITHPSMEDATWQCLVNSVSYMNHTPGLVPQQSADGHWRRLEVVIQPNHSGALEILLKGRGRGTVWIDDAHLEGKLFPALDQLASSSYRTLLKKADNVPNAVILVTTDTAEAAAAANLAQRLELPTRMEPHLPGPFPQYPLAEIDPHTNIILISSGEGGPLTQALRRAQWIAEDRRVPGRDGYAIRTIARPFAKSTANVIVISAGDPSMLERACAAFSPAKGENGELSYDRFLLMQAGPEWAKVRGPAYTAVPGDSFLEQFEAYRKGASGRAIGEFSGLVADFYYHTGNDEYARIYKSLFEKVSFISTDAHMGLYGLVRGWDLVEESPVFTAADRLRITRFILETLDSREGYGARVQHSASRFSGPIGLRHNHSMILANGLLQGYLYFSRLYDLDRAQAWKAWADDTAAHVTAWGGPEDSTTYQIRSFAEAARHYRWQGLSTRNQPGTELWPLQARRFLMAGDQYGLPATFGDCFMTATTYVPLGFICGDNLEGQVFRDGLTEWLKVMYEDWGDLSAQWMIDRTIAAARLFKAEGYDQFASRPADFPRSSIGVDAALPEFAYLFGSPAVVGAEATSLPALEDAARDTLTGLIKIPKSRGYYDYRAGTAQFPAHPWFAPFAPTWQPPYERSFDKLAWRSGLGYDAEYLLVDGIGDDMDHGHHDLGSLVRYMNGGHIWVADYGYWGRGLAYHSAVEVKQDGKPEGEMVYDWERFRRETRFWPGMAELIETTGSLADDTYAFAFRVEQYCGTSLQWERRITGKQGVLTVHDKLTAGQPGHYDLTWRMRFLGKLTGENQAWKVQQDGAELPVKLDAPAGDRVECVPMSECSQGITEGYRKYYFYPYVDPAGIPQVLVWARSLDLKAGESVEFQSVLGPTNKTEVR